MSGYVCICVCVHLCVYEVEYQVKCQHLLKDSFNVHAKFLIRPWAWEWGELEGVGLSSEFLPA